MHIEDDKTVARRNHLFPNKRIIGAVVGMAIDETADLFAMKNGLFVIVQAGDQVRLANDETFVPREW